MTKPTEMFTYEIRVACEKSEVSEVFLQGMANRMAVSRHKYGLAQYAYPDHVDALASLVQRIELYQTTGNTEYLVDAANFAMLEFMFPAISGAEFQPTDSDGSPGRTLTTGEVTAERNV